MLLWMRTTTPEFCHKTNGRITLTVLTSLVIVLVLLGVCSLAIGSVSVPVQDVVAILADSWFGIEKSMENEQVISRAHAEIVQHIRPPRLLLAICVGAALSLCGAAMQGFFQNPMADPYIIGVSSGAALGGTIAISFAIDFWVVGVHSTSVFAFCGALIVVAVVNLVATRSGRIPVSVLLLTGIAIGSMAAAATSFLMITSETGLHRMMFWLMGSLSGRRWDHVHMMWPGVLIGACVLQVYARDINLILQGDEQALSLGVDLEHVKRVILIITAMLTAVAVAVSGIIGFVGLIVPHLMRLIVGPDHRRLFPASLLGGAIIMVAADIVARIVIAPAEMPLGVITALLGCPFFLYILSRRT
tara:strand:+ start:1946 stop:3022 length:1077 start_codon:yes stop_codon:yes gene_type:complete